MEVLPPLQLPTSLHVMTDSSMFRPIPIGPLPLKSPHDSVLQPSDSGRHSGRTVERPIAPVMGMAVQTLLEDDVEMSDLAPAPSSAPIQPQQPQPIPILPPAQLHPPPEFMRIKPRPIFGRSVSVSALRNELKNPPPATSPVVYQKILNDTTEGLIRRNWNIRHEPYEIARSSRRLSQLASEVPDLDRLSLLSPREQLEEALETNKDEMEIEKIQMDSPKQQASPPPRASMEFPASSASEPFFGILQPSAPMPRTESTDWEDRAEDEIVEPRLPPYVPKLQLDKLKENDIPSRAQALLSPDRSKFIANLVSPRTAFSPRGRQRVGPASSHP